MKRALIGFLLGLGMLCAEAQQGKTIAELNKHSPFLSKTYSFQAATPPQNPEILTLSRIDQTNNGAWESELMTTLFRIPNPEITTGWYAVTGEVAYQNLPSDSKLGDGRLIFGHQFRKGRYLYVSNK